MAIHGSVWRRVWSIYTVLLVTSWLLIWTETMLYGMNTVLFIMCVYILVYGRGKSKGVLINKPLLVTAIVLYTLCAAHVINDFGRAITAFISYKNNPDGATAYFVQLWHWSSILREAIYCVSNSIANALLVYQLYVVWNFNVKMIIGPI
ncbi:hypothetical protein MPER_05419, partial [Moniliophthora perniciosa FA553]